MWTGWDGNDGKHGGPVIANDELGYGWHTYPERLEKAGISWKIYQDIGEGLDMAGVWGFTSDPYIGNNGDNSLLYFFNYQNATPGSALYKRARTGTDVKNGGGFFEILAADVKHGRLPSVSWIVAPEAYTEHPAFGRDRRITLHGPKEFTIDTRHSGGWYDIALTTPSDAGFSYVLAGRLESGARLTSDPQLGR